MSKGMGKRSKRMGDERKNGHAPAVSKGAKKDKVRLLLADDHSLFRAGLKDLLDGTSNFQIIAEASTGPEASSRRSTPRPAQARALSTATC